MELVLLRHFKTKYNKQNKLTGWLDSEVDRELVNKQKIEHLRKQLNQINIKTIIISDLKRTKETLNILELNLNQTTLLEEPAIRERDYGYLSGKNKIHLKKKLNTLYEKYHRSYYISPPAGESFYFVEERVKKLLKKLANNQQNTLIVAHGNSIRMLKKILENQTTKECEKENIEFYELYRYKIEKEDKYLKIKNIRTNKITKIPFF